MSRTVDKLQQRLRDEVFHYALDGKKAAGRALGTLVEIVTYYKLCSWGFSKNLLIERPISEFGRPDIRHNVEFSAHRIIQSKNICVPKPISSITARALAAAAEIRATRTTEKLLCSRSILRNAALIAENEDHLVVANLLSAGEDYYVVTITDLNLTPIAIFECKRVGVEEGMRKGPQSIEKAKQGAYVARSVSALQKVITADGQTLGFLARPGQEPLVGDYDNLLEAITLGRMEPPQGFVMTVGVVSNHGNWFTAENMNKEMKVLASAYDWLLFLTDEGLMDFVEECIFSPDGETAVVRTAFLASYTGERGGNRFTKTKLDLEADQALKRYFNANRDKSDRWFNVIAPAKRPLQLLASELNAILAQ